jgi:hypothetical protein
MRQLLTTISLFALAPAHLYLPLIMTPTPAVQYVDYGTIFGVARCENGLPAAQAVIYFEFAAGGGTWGIANNDGEFIIVAKVGRVGILTWRGVQLSGVLTVATGPAIAIEVILDCTGG